MNRRNFLHNVAFGAGTPLWGLPRARRFRGKRHVQIWASSDPHIPADAATGYKPLETAIRQVYEHTDGRMFDTELICGDFFASQTAPTDDEGSLIPEQFLGLGNSFYRLAGNHDANLEDLSTFDKWVDPLGVNTGDSWVDARRRPFQIAGTAERYFYRVGNVLILMLSDINYGPGPAGRADGRGGHPAGRVDADTFHWWRDVVEWERERNPDSIIVTCAHHMLKDTTYASGPWEGVGRLPDGTRIGPAFHGNSQTGAGEGTSYLFFIRENGVDIPDAQWFENYLAEHPGATDIWIGGHTHPHYPEMIEGGKGPIMQKWGAVFLNCAGLTASHGPAFPMSRVLTIDTWDRTVQIALFLHRTPDDVLSQHRFGQPVIKDYGGRYLQLSNNRGRRGWLIPQ